MNKSLLLAIAILAAITLCVWYFTSTPAPMQDGASVASTTPIVPTTQKNAAPAKTTTKTTNKGVPDSQTSYKSLLTQSGSFQCDYDQVKSTGTSHNVIYLYGGKMRGEFRTNNADGSATANLFVYDGQYMYQWKEGTSVGTRTLLTSLSQLPFAIPKDLTSGGIVGSNYESVGWLCHTWLTNKSLLSPPSYVSFK